MVLSFIIKIKGCQSYIILLKYCFLIICLKLVLFGFNMWLLLDLNNEYYMLKSY